MAQTATTDKTIQVSDTLVTPKRPGVGIGVYVFQGDKVLIGKRGAKSTHAVDVWGGPGGMVEYGESLEDAARREVREEAGIEIKNIRVGSVTSDVFQDKDRHDVTVCMMADYESGEATVLEEGKMEHWEWVPWADITKYSLMLTVQNFLRQGWNPLARTLQVGVKALITNSDGQYLLFQRREPRPGENHRIWEIPGGRIELGEEIDAALAREVLEETDLVVAKVGRCVGVQSILRNPKLHVVRNTFEVEVSGTLRPFTSDDEHDKAEWFTTAQIKDLTLDPYLREVFETKLTKENA